MRGDQRLERGSDEERRAGRARLGTGLALALVLASAAAGVHAAERPDLGYPERAPTLPEPEPSPALPAAPDVVLAPSELRLLWFDPKNLLPSAFDIASREVSRIFRGVGVEVRFEQGTPGIAFGE